MSLTKATYSLINGAPINVLDFIPAAMHASIAARTNTDNLTAYFQAAAVAANAGDSTGPGPGGTVYIPNGTYSITKVGIRDTVFVGENRDGVILKAFSAGANADFMLDATLDRDGVTVNTSGNGWAENLTFDSNNSARSCLRTYGGGCTPRNLWMRNTTGYGLRMGLPIWAQVSNCYAADCDLGGFSTYATSDTGTSTTFLDCWANSCATYGFHIANLYYSSFINCVSQDSGTGFYVEGNAGGLSAVYSLQFIGCAHEGTGTPFNFKKCRDLTVLNARVIDAAATVDYITFDDSQGSVRDTSSQSTPGAGKYGLKIINHGSGDGSILVDNSTLTYDSAAEVYITQSGGTLNSVMRFNGLRYDWNNATAGQRVSSVIQDVDGYTGLVLKANDGTKLAQFRRIGTPIFATSGEILTSSSALGNLDVSFYVNGNDLTFKFKTAGGTVKTGTVTGV
jgi:hypothetical protein